MVEIWVNLVFKRADRRKAIYVFCSFLQIYGTRWIYGLSSEWVAMAEHGCIGCFWVLYDEHSGVFLSFSERAEKMEIRERKMEKEDKRLKFGLL